MDEQKPIDVNLLKRMMLGDFSASSSEGMLSSKEIHKSNSPQRKVELHFEKLYPTKNNIPPGEKLKLQLEEFSQFLKDLKKKNIRIAYVIVGKGEGVLRAEVKKVLLQNKIHYSEVAEAPYFGNAIKISS
jgi:dsDNA-specific endonuclease/ATPase MutS2